MTDHQLRLDKWLWFARFFKSRSIASALCQSGRVRLAGERVRKASQQVRVGDVLTFPQGRHIRVIKVIALGERRGPASEAQTLYEDLAPPNTENRMPREAVPSPALRGPGTGRPTKKERRKTDKLRAPES